MKNIFRENSQLSALFYFLLTQIFIFSNPARAEEISFPRECLSALGRYSQSKYLDVLSSSGAISLYRLEKTHSAQEIYRLTILNPLSGTRSINVNVNATSNVGILTDYVKSGIDNERTSSTFLIESEKVKKLQIAFQAKEFRDLKSQEGCIGCKDGSQWLLESFVNGRYKCVEDREPSQGMVRNIGTILLGYTVDSSEKK